MASSGVDDVSGETGSAVLRTAEIVAVGSELLTPHRTDTNSLYLTKRLNELGIRVCTKVIVGDDCDDLSHAVRQAMDRADLTVTSGGLGPTDDDLTRIAVSQVLSLPLSENSGIVDRIEARFASRGLRMPAVNRRQAMVPHGAIVLENARGTAPGLWIERDEKVVVLLPGPPRELQPMFNDLISGRLAERAGPERLFRRELRITGRTESDVEERAQPVYSRWRAEAHPISTTILAAPGQIEIHLVMRAPTRADADVALDRAVAELHDVLGPSIYSNDGRSLEAVVGQLLRNLGLRVSIAESCTGGLLASRLTDVPGSSAYVEQGVVAYSNAAKTSLLGVPADLIEKNGAVSEPVATAMASGARDRSSAEIGVGVTGIAGPGGATDGKPVGTVAIAVAGPDDAGWARTFRFPGGRSMVKFQASQTALDMVRRVLQRGQPIAQTREPG